MIIQILPNTNWSELDKIIAEQDAYYGRTACVPIDQESQSQAPEDVGSSGEVR